MSHIFISYSKKNRVYARPLADRLLERGFDVWIDEVIEPGDGWFASIRAAIRDCAAFVLLMTPESENSHWVNLELLHALEYRKPIFPLLRAGSTNPLDSDVWAQIANIQITDVRDGSMPPERFYERLMKRGVPRKGVSAGADVTPPPPAPPADSPLPPPASPEAAQPAPTKPASLALMPAPFAWIEIPKKGYSIAKYPVTNAQFAKFMEAGGYGEKRWWTAEGWQKCQEGWHYDGGWKPSGTPWTEPRYWRDSKWNGAEQPVVGVSWFEAVAFCLWLSEATGEKIMLPTEAQWQYAAQGDDGRDYPWGKKWDGTRCNNNVDKKGIGKTTPVRLYEGKGDSAFGVVDMAGNVWEWCLTDYDNKTNDVNSYANRRVLRGGSWYDSGTDFFRCDYRVRSYPHSWDYSGGVRLALS